ncbi:MAG: hypothetical protein CMM47_06620 [Rhodospirillaceae bacterium]|nr:hypothetical protein [Rhodospirillaceae bacterium]
MSLSANAVRNSLAYAFYRDVPTNATTRPSQRVHIEDVSVVVSPELEAAKAAMRKYVRVAKRLRFKLKYNATEDQS